MGTVGFALVQPTEPELRLLHRWMDCWRGVNDIAVGMHRQASISKLTQYEDRGWRATFYTTGTEHSPTSATGTARDRTPWQATQRAAWEALRKSGMMT